MLLRFSQRSVSVLVTSFVAILIARADVNRFANLLAESPFGSQREIAVTERTLEFRGYVYTGESVVFNIACADDNGRLRCTWVEIGETNADYTVRSFDRNSDSVEVVYQGQRRTLGLKQGRVNLLSGSGYSAASVDPTAVVDGKTQLESVTAEIRRRRALRQASAENNELPEL